MRVAGGFFNLQVIRANKLAEAAHDYWRQQLYPMAGPALDQALTVWKDVEALTKDASNLTRHDVPASAGDGTLTSLIETVSAERQATLVRLKEGWAGRATAMQQWIDRQMAAKPCAFDGRKLAARHYTGWLHTLAQWASDPEADELDMKTGATRFTPAGMQGATKAGATITLPPELTPSSS